eukprot:scaffold75069_cov58-Phaeocystis_antarctica.AAC.1
MGGCGAGGGGVEGGGVEVAGAAAVGTTAEGPAGGGPGGGAGSGARGVGHGKGAGSRGVRGSAGGESGAWQGNGSYTQDYGDRISPGNGITGGLSCDVAAGEGGVDVTDIGGAAAGARRWLPSGDNGEVGDSDGWPCRVGSDECSRAVAVGVCAAVCGAAKCERRGGRACGTEPAGGGPGVEVGCGVENTGHGKGGGSRGSTGGGCGAW